MSALDSKDYDRDIQNKKYSLREEAIE